MTEEHDTPATPPSTTLNLPGWMIKYSRFDEEKGKTSLQNMTWAVNLCLWLGLPASTLFFVPIFAPETQRDWQHAVALIAASGSLGGLTWLFLTHANGHPAFHYRELDDEGGVNEAREALNRIAKAGGDWSIWSLMFAHDGLGSHRFHQRDLECLRKVVQILPRTEPK